MIPTFNDPNKGSFGNTVAERENAGNQHFLLFPQCFLLYQRKKSSLQHYLICSLQCFQFGYVQKFVGIELNVVQ